MIGCLTLPFRIATALLVIVALVAAWIYREDITRFGRQQLGMPALPDPTGYPDPSSAARARARMDASGRQGADSLVLSATEMASLIAEELRQRTEGGADSIRVELRDREVAIMGRVSTEPIPATIRDLLGGALTEREEVELSGPLTLQRAGVGQFEVRRVRVKGFPVPRDLVDRLVGRYVPRTDGGIVFFDVPAWITGIRVTPQGAILYGGRTP